MIFYRYILVQYVTKDSDGEYIESKHPSPTLTLIEYNLISETPKGYWIGSFGYKEKWIPKISRKRFAYPTKKEALHNFVKRTEKRIKILDFQLSSCIIGLSLAKSKKDK